jgi:hypothetical protein
MKTRQKVMLGRLQMEVRKHCRKKRKKKEIFRSITRKVDQKLTNSVIRKLPLKSPAWEGNKLIVFVFVF